MRVMRVRPAYTLKKTIYLQAKKHPFRLHGRIEFSTVPLSLNACFAISNSIGELDPPLPPPNGAY